MDNEPNTNRGPHPEDAYRVGYCRPPIESRFKKGQKPPSRKPKGGRKKESAKALLYRLLEEERRAEIGRRVGWYTTVELLVRTAWQLVDKNPTIARLLVEMDFQNEPESLRTADFVLPSVDGSPPGVIRNVPLGERGAARTRGRRRGARNGDDEHA